MKSRDFSIAMVRAAAFQTAAHQKGTQLFFVKTMHRADYMGISRLEF